MRYVTLDDRSAIYRWYVYVLEDRRALRVTILAYEVICDWLSH